jgi:hypothetical protein
MKKISAVGSDWLLKRVNAIGSCSRMPRRSTRVFALSHSRFERQSNENVLRLFGKYNPHCTFCSFVVLEDVSSDLS